MTAITTPAATATEHASVADSNQLSGPHGLATGSSATAVPLKPKRKGVSGLKPFVKGDPRINRSGRSKSYKDFRERCREYMQDGGGWERLVAMANGSTRDGRPALELIAAYGYGRPPQVFTGDEENGPLQIIISAAVNPGLSVDEQPRGALPSGATDVAIDGTV